MITPTGPSTGANSELLKAINSLTKSIDGISKSLGSRDPLNRKKSSTPDRLGNSSSGLNQKFRRTSDAEYERNKRLTKMNEKNALELLGCLHDFSKSIRNFETSTKANKINYKENLKKQNEHTKALLENSKMSVKHQDLVNEQMKKLLKSSDTFKNLKLKGTSPAAQNRELVDIQESMNRVLGRAADLTTRRGVKDVSQLGAKDMKSLASTISAAGLNLEGADEIKKLDKRIADKKSGVAALTKAKADPSRIAKINAEIIALETEKHKKLGPALERAITSAKNFDRSLVSSTKLNFAFSAATEQVKQHFLSLGASSISLVGSFELLAKAANIYYGSMLQLAKQQMGGAFWDISINALKLRASFDTTIKYLKTFGYQVSQLGMDRMVNIYTDNIKNFSKMGLFGDDAVEAFGDAADNLMNMGVHPKRRKQFDRAMDGYTDRINDMAKLTGMSAKELMAMDKELISSKNTQDMLLRLNAQERNEKIKSILVEKDRIQKMVGSNAEAQKFIQTLQALNNQSPEKRIETSMKAFQLMQMTGMGGDASRLSAILMKRDEQLTDSEREFKTNTLMELGTRVNKMKSMGMSQEMIINSLMEGQPEAMRKAIEDAASAQLSKENRGSIDDKSKAAQETKDNYQIGAANAKLGEWGAMLGNIITNPIVRILELVLGAATMIVGWLAIKKNGGVGGTIDKVKGLFGKKGGGAGTLASDVGSAAGRVEQTVANAAGSAAPAARTATTTAATTAADATGGLARTGGKMAAVKTAGKTLLKKIPIIGAIAGLALASGRAIGGDWAGAGMEAASGIAGTIPGIGTAASLAIDGALVARDMSNSATPAESTSADVNSSSINPSAQQANVESQKINNGSILDPEQAESSSDPLKELANSISQSGDVNSSKQDKIIELLEALLVALQQDKSGLIEALQRNSNTMTFNGLQDKRSLFAAR